MVESTLSDRRIFNGIRDLLFNFSDRQAWISKDGRYVVRNSYHIHIICEWGPTSDLVGLFKASSTIHSLTQCKNNI